MDGKECFQVFPIGFVRSVLKERRGAPRQGWEGAPDADLEIAPDFTLALDGLSARQEIWVLTWLHQSQRSVLKVHPRDDTTNPETGVFATRSADRPNPIGLHRVSVLKVEGNRLTVRPLEAIEGTPILDIKPVLEQIDLF
ncbi:MAG: tRNA (N6-threonylcarbamoyladenosine(37)-N6)-methyltransferase TrmO [Bryobacteraceae bacterium]